MTLLVDALFVATTLGLVAVVATRLPTRGTLLLLGWLLVTGVLGATGALLPGGRVTPLFAAVLVVPTAAGIAFVYSRAGTAALRTTSTAQLVGLQGFRISVEIVLWALAVQHRLPRLLTFEGRNFDVLVGLTALPVAWLCFVRRRWPPMVARVWNVAGVVILLNVVVHAQLSAPAPWRIFYTDPPSTIIAGLPYIWLPGFLVPLALVLHVASLRRLADPRAKEA
jgi:hypothetical protein